MRVERQQVIEDLEAFVIVVRADLAELDLEAESVEAQRQVLTGLLLQADRARLELHRIRSKGWQEFVGQGWEAGTGLPLTGGSRR